MKNKLKNARQEQGAQGAPERIRIGTADELQAIINQPLYCRFRIDKREIELPVTRLTASTSEAVRKLLREVPLPPYIEQRKDYDWMNRKYGEAKQLADRQARAWVIYNHCPLVAAKQPGLTEVTAVHKFVEGLFTENLLEVIAATIQSEGVDLNVEARANFTLPPASES